MIRVNGDGIAVDADDDIIGEKKQRAIPVYAEFAELNGKGVLFRVVHEAKAAAFWTRHDIPWVYEPESSLGAGLKWRPDFWIPPLGGTSDGKKGTMIEMGVVDEKKDDRRLIEFMRQAALIGGRLVIMGTTGSFMVADQLERNTPRLRSGYPEQDALFHDECGWGFRTFDSPCEGCGRYEHDLRHTNFKGVRRSEIALRNQACGVKYIIDKTWWDEDSQARELVAKAQLPVVDFRKEGEQVEYRDDRNTDDWAPLSQVYRLTATGNCPTEEDA